MMKELSKMELSNATDEEKAAVRYFTSANYEWINDALYKGSLDAVEDGFDEDFGYETEDSFDASYDPLTDAIQENNNTSYEFYKGDKINPHTYYSYDHKNKTAFYETVELLDNLMEKAPKKQRIVYRGMSSLNSFLNDQGKTTEEWLNDSMKLGQEIKFDGYQSSTPDFQSAVSFACDQSDGIIFEIRTPEGINITSISEVDAEKEILLPRDSRYMVVGIHKGLTVQEDSVNVVQLVAMNDEGEILDGSNHSPKSLIEQYNKEKVTI